VRSVVNESGFSSYDFQVHNSTPQHLPCCALIVCDSLAHERTVEQFRQRDNPRWRVDRQPGREGGDTNFRGVEDTLEALQISRRFCHKREGIDRPGTWPQDCDGGTHRRQEDAASQMVGARESDPDMSDRLEGRRQQASTNRGRKIPAPAAIICSASASCRGSPISLVMPS